MTDANWQQFEVRSENPAGIIRQGNVGADNTPVVVYQSNQFDPVSGSRNVILATGLLSTPVVYDYFGQTGMSLGHNVVVFGHDHQHHKWPIRANAADIVEGVDSLELDSFVSVGHSMGCIAMLLAQENPDFAANNEQLILANLPMTGRYRLIDVFNLNQELAVLAANRTLDIARTGVGAACEVAQRPRVIAKQVFRLVTGQVHERIDWLTAEAEAQTAVSITAIYSQYDGLVPPRWSKSLADHKVRVLLHRSKLRLGHFAVIFDPDMINGVFSIASGQNPGQNFEQLQPKTAKLALVA